ncbi:pyruvate decarboxylase [Cryphonectria parasitica EP155]|uniref:Pyruvate decarboxylase n=1 Tax=Cryphonectria parasitica (strain ATCC 38755 / EP155) TaxID=660469 RepID=A0A9P4XZG4_CRYP1|nr:pyruvate decarboxylase [Cryphonectria parasitica EP155]KAF3763756.1 pyruvate decarboxylase [Cryphonectria parasitica EP155]
MGSTDYRLEKLEQPVDVSEYLFRRLYEVGIRSVHGLPGDYNLVSLDYVRKAGLRWVGNVNELNAAYAADGYARVKGISALVTTFGVGELSALNGIAGAYAEQVPLIHIVGCPSTTSERNGLLLHHTLGNGDFNVFKNMSAQISCYVAKLNRPNEIADEIDHAIRECWIRSRPVYIMLPSDMASEKIEGARLKTPLDMSESANDPEKEDYVVDVILKYLYAAKNPVLLVDACAIRHRCLDEVNSLLKKTNLPTFVAPMGKGAVNEQAPNYGGVYAGNASHPSVAKAVEGADLVLSIGALKSDFNTAGFSYRLSQLNTIDLHSTHCTVRYSEYPGVAMRGVLRKITDRIVTSQLSIRPLSPVDNGPSANDNDGSQTITQSWLWPRISGYLRENDIVVTETGTANFGIWETKFPQGVTALNQNLWGSIGWSVGACQGAALATRDTGDERRTILFVGDGSFQLTAQEVSTIIRHQLRVTLFVICNEGYTIERFIHGADEAYNDIATWRFKDLPAAFGAHEGETRTFVARTKAELEALLGDKSFQEAAGLQFVELYMPKMDAPGPLRLITEAAVKNNSKAAE